jgi:hypothetical protein
MAGTSTTILEHEKEPTASSSSALPPVVATKQQQQQQQSPPPTNPIAKMELALMETLADFHVRSEVESCLNSLLVDVEIANNLRQQLQVKNHQTKVEQVTRQQEVTMEETKALLQEKEEHRTTLADSLVQELWTLSGELQVLLQWKQKHEHKIQNYDEIMSKLAQAEETVLANAAANSMNGRASGPAAVVAAAAAPPTQLSPTIAKPTTPPTIATTEATTDPVKKEQIPEPPPSSEETIEEESKDKVAKQPIEPEKQAETTDELAPNEVTQQQQQQHSKEQEQVPEEEKKPLAKSQGESEPTTATVVKIPSPATADADAGGTTTGTMIDIPDEAVAQGEAAQVEEEPGREAVVSLDVDEPEEEVPGLAEIDVEILMRIFGCLDAHDILNTAQINIAMYSRVDSLFGISADGHRAPTASSPSPPTPAQQPSVQPAAQKQQSKAPTAVVTKPPPTDSKPAAAASKEAATSSSMGAGLFSMLQPRSTTAAAAGRTATTTATSKRQETQKHQPLNAAVAQSMAAKLSDSELAAIISMTEKLSKMEKEVTALRADKEGIQAKLDGTEAVKQFLIGKVRDFDVKLGQSREDEIKVTQQIASDQEVIAFLDGQVQELESTTSMVKKEKTTADTELKNLKASSSQKVTVLSDMLKYEREKSRESESDWKATKKVLVKEVKNCRAQIVALQAERDGYKEQSEMLKRAIVSKSSSPSSRKNSF